MIFRAILLAVFFVSVVQCAPADETTTAPTTTTTAVAVTTSKPADERAVVVGDTSWTSMLPANTWPVVSWVAGGAAILGGLGFGSYYLVYKKYYDADDTGSAYTAYNYPNYNQQYSNYPSYQTGINAVARALDTTSSLNWTAVIELIDLAQDTYEKFDFQSLDCQKKALCDLAQKQNEFGETGRKISNSMTYVTNVSKRYMDLLEGLPIPQIIKTYLREYSSAINQGKISTKDCSIYYPKCQFAIKETFVKVQKKINQL